MKKNIFLFITIFAYNLCNASAPVQAAAANASNTSIPQDLAKTLISELKEARKTRKQISYTPTYENLLKRAYYIKNNKDETTKGPVNDKDIAKAATSKEEFKSIEEIKHIDQKIEFLKEQMKTNGIEIPLERATLPRTILKMRCE